MGVDHQLATIVGIRNVTTSYWVKNMKLSFGLFIKAHMNLNGLERLYDQLG